MKLKMPSPRYIREDEVERNRQLEAEDRRNFKRGQDVEVGSGRVILTASDGSRWALQVSTSGALSTVAV